MAKNYLLQFGFGDPSTKAGLAPTFITFKTVIGGNNVTAPGITQIPSSSGLYYFTYGPTTSIAFTVDGATTSLTTQERYISGLIDPIDAVDEQVTLLQATMISNFQNTGSSLGALGTLVALMGTTGSTFGGSAVDPTTIFGYLKRSQEFMEGNSTFTKSTGVWNIYSRGSSNLLASKTVADTSTQVTKV